MMTLIQTLWYCDGIHHGTMIVRNGIYMVLQGTLDNYIVLTQNKYLHYHSRLYVQVWYMFKRAWNYHLQFSVVKGNSFILSNINVKGLLNIANSQSSILNLKKKPHPSSSVERSTHTHRHTRTRSFYLMSVTHSSADGKVCLHGHFDEVRVSLTARDCASVCCLRLRVGVRLAWAELVKNPVSLTPAYIQRRPLDLTLFLKHHRSNTWEQISPALSRKPRWNSIPFKKKTPAIKVCI